MEAFSSKQQISLNGSIPLHLPAHHPPSLSDTVLNIVTKAVELWHHQTGIVYLDAVPEPSAGAAFRWWQLHNDIIILTMDLKKFVIYYGTLIMSFSYLFPLWMRHGLCTNLRYDIPLEKFEIIYYGYCDFMVNHKLCNSIMFVISHRNWQLISSVLWHRYEVHVVAL